MMDVIFIGERLPVFYFDRISVKEEVDLESCKDYDKLIDVTLSKRCSGCHVIFYNKSNFNHQEQTCDRCYKMLLGTSFEPKQIHVIWWNNCKCRVLTTLRRAQAQRLIEKIKTQDRYRYVDIDNLAN